MIKMRREFYFKMKFVEQVSSFKPEIWMLE
jgi:hypothetical protein